jgi:hypothetical protein
MAMSKATERQIDLIAAMAAEMSAKPASWWRQRLVEEIEQGPVDWREDETFAEYAERRAAEVAAVMVAKADA